VAVIEDALVALLRADATVSGLVGSRIYPIVAPAEATLPALVYQRISGPRVMTHDGPSGLAHPRFQFRAVARHYSEAKGLVNALRSALDGYHGTTSGVTIDEIAIDNEIDAFYPSDDEAADSYEILVDFIVWHHE